MNFSSRSKGTFSLEIITVNMGLIFLDTVVYPKIFLFLFNIYLEHSSITLKSSLDNGLHSGLQNLTEVLFLPVVSSPLFSVFGLNLKGPEAFSSALFFVH